MKRNLIGILILIIAAFVSHKITSHAIAYCRPVAPNDICVQSFPIIYDCDTSFCDGQAALNPINIGETEYQGEICFNEDYTIASVCVSDAPSSLFPLAAGTPIVLIDNTSDLFTYTYQGKAKPGNSFCVITYTVTPKS